MLPVGASAVPGRCANFLRHGFAAGISGTRQPVWRLAMKGIPPPNHRIASVRRLGRYRPVFLLIKSVPSRLEPLPVSRLIPANWRIGPMLVERGVRVMNMGVVGDAYDIAVNYLRRSGAIPDDFTTNDRLLEIIVKMFHRGEINKIRLANAAIARFEALDIDNLA